MNEVLPDLSHYYGRRVEDILQYPPAEDEPSWAIVLEGGITIQNYDEAMPVPGDHIKGQVFTNTTLAPKVTSMFFGGLGGNTVSLNPTKYAIGTGDKLFFPQATEHGADKYQVVPEPEGRTAEGPSEEWLSASAEQARRDMAGADDED
jgi:hypothetical protein